MCAVLLEESLTPTPQVAGGHLSQTPCPRVPNASLIMIFLPRINLFYIMIHAVGTSPQPFMRIPWLGCTQVSIWALTAAHLSSTLSALPCTWCTVQLCHGR